MSLDITFLTGLPRTGSTLLTSILSQNSAIHTEGNSALCQLMWDTQVSCWNTEQVKNKPNIENTLLKSLPELFYKNVSGHIIDKCRSWTMPDNLDLIDKYITKEPKFIVMLRSITDIVKSFVYVRTLNGWENAEQGLLDTNSEPIMRSFNGVKHALSINKGQFLFVQYEDLVNNPNETINNIYDFLGWQHYQHDFERIENKTPENDEHLKLIGLHDIRQTLGKRKIEIIISNSLLNKANNLDKEMAQLGLSYI